MIDFKLSVKNEKDNQLFNLLSQVRSHRPGQADLPSKSEPIDTMPYFLTSEYATIIKKQKEAETTATLDSA